MPDLTAIILAAGRGIRMGPRGPFSPKGLLRLSERTLVEDSIAHLRAGGIGRVRIVTGHLAQAYQRAANSWKGDIELRHNPDYAAQGSLLSLMVGLDGIDGPCIVLESDLVYERRALDALDDSGRQSVLVLSGPTGAGDEVHVWADPLGDGTRHRLRDMSKRLDRWPDRPHGELVGITALSATAVRQLKVLAPALLAERAHADYEEGLAATARTEDILCHRIDGLLWAEIDDERMLARAARLYPDIRNQKSEVRNQKSSSEF